jgi:ubiquinone/menaquinone biosynthesis C-methylase UbiE
MNHKQAIQRNFARRGATYNRYARIQQWMAAELLRGCREALLRARSILEVGCGTGYLTELVRRANPTARIVALDLEVSLARLARERLKTDPLVHFVAADGEAFAGGCYDLIISNSVFQWFARPPETLQEYYGLLHPGGSLAFSTLGPATFRELDTAFRQAAGSLPLAESPEVVALSFSDEGLPKSGVFCRIRDGGAGVKRWMVFFSALKSCYVEPPPSAVRSPAGAPAPHFSCLTGDPKAREELF